MEAFVPAEKLENSVLKFTCFKKNGEPPKFFTEEIIFLKDVDYFEAINGPIFNIQKYLLIGESKEQKDLVCVVLGLEFYVSKKIANLLKTDVKKLLFSNLKDIPLLLVQDHPPVQMTPTLSSWIGGVKSSLYRGKED